MIVGNKLDSERAVQRETAQNWARERGYDYMEVSAKTGENIELAFHNIATQLSTQHIHPTETPTKISTEKPKSEGSCC